MGASYQKAGGKLPRMLILWDKNGKIQKWNNLNNLVQISDFIFFNFKQQYKVLFIKNRWKIWKLYFKK